MNRVLNLVVLTLLITNSAWAQKNNDDGPVGIFDSRAEYNRFMGNAKQTAYGPNGNSELQAMIPLLNDIALNQPIGSTANQYNTEGSTFGLLSDKAIRSELEMVDEQFDDLKRMNEEVQARVAKQIRGLNFEDSRNLTSQIRAIRDQAREDLNSVLLPHQVSRLNQLQLQARSRHRSFVDILTSDPVKSELEISDKQSKDLKEEEKEIQEELEKEIAKLRENARKRLLSKLKSDQRKQVEEMFGETFEFKDSKKEKGRKNSKRSSKVKGQGK